jgi:hypothetical protein
VQDIWVARSSDGEIFSNNFPFSRHAPTAQRIITGQPTPVQ